MSPHMYLIYVRSIIIWWGRENLLHSLAKREREKGSPEGEECPIYLRKMTVSTVSKRQKPRVYSPRYRSLVSSALKMTRRWWSVGRSVIVDGDHTKSDPAELTRRCAGVADDSLAARRNWCFGWALRTSFYNEGQALWNLSFQDSSHWAVDLDVNHKSRPADMISVSCPWRSAVLKKYEEMWGE